MQIKQGTTAFVYVYMVDSTDGYTPETGVVSPTIYITKNGGTPALPSNGAWSELSAANMPGLYKVAFNTIDTDTVGPLAIDVVKAGVSRHFVAACYISAALTDDVKTDTADILTDTGTAGVLLAATANSAALVDAVWDEPTAGHTGAGTTGKALTDAQGAGDPWSTNLPGAYTGSQAGRVIGRITQGSGANITTITVQNEDDVALEGVTVDIFDSSAPSDSAFITTGTTDTAGEISFYLPTGTYYAFRYLRGYSFSADPITVVVS